MLSAYPYFVLKFKVQVTSNPLCKLMIFLLRLSKDQLYICHHFIRNSTFGNTVKGVMFELLELGEIEDFQKLAIG